MIRKGEKEKYKPSLTEIASHIKQTLNMSLNSNQETSYTLAFDVKATEKALYFVFYSPSALTLNNDLYNRIGGSIAANVYPSFSVYPQPSARLVEWRSDDIHHSAAWEFPWRRGISRRLVISNLSSFLDKYSTGSKVWLMPDYSIDVEKLTSLAIMGASGSGKTMLLKYLNTCFSRMGKVITIDPKASKDLVWWGKENAQKVIFPTAETSKSDFLSTVNDQLSQVLQTIYRRQNNFLEDKNAKFNPIFVTIDELAALTVGVNRSLKDAFFSLLQSLVLLGRETNIHLILVSQQLDNSVLPTSCREQTNVRILLGSVTSRSTQFLFPDYDTSSVVIPTGVATGIVQTINSKEVPALTPFLAPTIKEGGN